MTGEVPDCMNPCQDRSTAVGAAYDHCVGTILCSGGWRPLAHVGWALVNFCRYSTAGKKHLSKFTLLAVDNMSRLRLTLPHPRDWRRSPLVYVAQAVEDGKYCHQALPHDYFIVLC